MSGTKRAGGQAPTDKQCVGSYEINSFQRNEGGCYGPIRLEIYPPIAAEAPRPAYSAKWHTASMLLPSGSITKAP